MKNGKVKIALASSVAMVLFSGCDFLDLSLGSNKDVVIDFNTTTDESASGQTADGYLVGAKVCLDKNSNGICDTGEPYTISEDSGRFVFEGLSKEYVAKYDLVTEVIPSTVDEDSDTMVEMSYNMSARKGINFISPLTSMVNYYIKDANMSVSNALSYVGVAIGINANEVESDYIQSGNADLHDTAKVVASLKNKFFAQVENDYDFQDQPKEIVNLFTDSIVFEQLNNISTEIKKRENDLNTISFDIFSNLSTAEYKYFKEEYLNHLSGLDDPAPETNTSFSTNSLYTIVQEDAQDYVPNAITFDIFENFYDSSSWYEYNIKATNEYGSSYVLSFHAKNTSNYEAPAKIVCSYKRTIGVYAIWTFICDAYDKNGKILFSDYQDNVIGTLTVVGQFQYVTKDGIYSVTAGNATSKELTINTQIAK